MKITQIRNATQCLEFGGVRFLIDPILCKKGSFPGFRGTLNEDLNNPLVDLPLPFERIVDVDAIFVSHTHQDHWDEVPHESLSKSLPVLVQDEFDAVQIRQTGFTDVRVVEDGMVFRGVTLNRTRTMHGVEAVFKAMPPEFLRVCGLVLGHPSEKTTYLAADTIWYDQVAHVIAIHRPEVIILNCGNAQVFGVGRVIMNASDVLEVYKAAPSATLVGTHMEAVNHCVLTRAALRAFSEQKGFSPNLLLPADGETLNL